MQNPFKKKDAVLTKLKGSVVEAIVTQTWKNEVQVKTTAGDLLWRTMYTVWRRGEAPLQRNVPTTAPAGVAANPSTRSSAAAHQKPERRTKRSSKSRPSKHS
jgi:hypothetical protein